MCHSSSSLEQQQQFIVGSGGASPLGNYQCDSSIALVMSAFQAMVHIEPNPDFIIFTGDDPPHVSTNELNRTLVLQSIQNVTNLITSHFPNIPIYPAIGKHQLYPGPNDWLFNNVSDMWSDLLTDQAQQTFKTGGYYTELVAPGQRIISLNTVFYYTYDVQCVNETDPGGQMAWLASTLSSAQSNNEKVWIIGHVPPGQNEKYDTPNFHAQFNDVFLSTFAKYSDVIVGHFYGHEHSDAFRLYYDSPQADFRSQPPTGVMFVAPSLTPWLNPYVPALPNNPSLRLYHYDPDAYLITDYDQYWSNLEQDIVEGAITWELEYRASEFFSTQSAGLNAQSMYKALQEMTINDTMLEMYTLYNSVSYESDDECDSVCRAVMLCSIAAPYTEQYGLFKQLLLLLLAIESMRRSKNLSMLASTAT
ncbi:hypothetical protein SAMD00019534_099160 [Acytostelium subglobosum LB1]|uniref:hypothetical protein n=1 Tax=Acytostelium subglobosum LB1 TaxID=1410327 RepID=UPI000645066B|nr:hypothetical protein SAMD00019534_099160 [Acytostelium subglobosum LB1]GAM26741.1 hypothetical protein SAMD00019534_099160 [Acytostelium subglobosum LB1]|eukprot:XP_012750402.1 hypothetical protein SAMD00019534_099160 [Acytostelium subglobosum LB1]